jgi:cytochrome c5
MNSRHLVTCILIACTFVPAAAFAQAVQQNKPPASQTTRKAAASGNATKPLAQQSDEGDHIFQQHCSRCHNTPEGFSPRISGTIVRHMRVRASLTQHEEEELLRFFNP